MTKSRQTGEKEEDGPRNTTRKEGPTLRGMDRSDRSVGNGDRPGGGG